MEQIFRMRDADGRDYDVPASEMDEFNAQVKNASRLTVRVGADGKKYDVPENEVKEFQSAVPDAQDTRTIRFANGETRDFTPVEMSRFLRSSEYREGEAYRADREAFQQNVAARMQNVQSEEHGDSVLKTAGMGAVANMNKVLRALPENATSAIRAVGNLSNAVGGAAKMAFGDDSSVGNGFSTAGKAITGVSDTAEKAWDEWAPQETASLVGNGKTDLGTRAAEFTGNVAKMAIKYLPAMRGKGAAQKLFMESMLASDAINAWTGTYQTVEEQAKKDAMAKYVAEGYSEADAAEMSKNAKADPVKANLLGAVSALVSYFGGKGLIKSGGLTNGIGNVLGRETATAGVSGAIMGAQGGANKAIENVATEKPVMQGVLEEAGKGFAEGAAFHAVNAIPRAGELMRTHKSEVARRKEREMVVEATATVLQEPGGADVWAATNPEGAQAITRQYAEKGHVSRKTAREALLPEMSAAQRDALAKDLIDQKARENKTRLDGEQTAALDEAVTARVGEDAAMKADVVDRVKAKLADAKEIDDPARRDELVRVALDEINRGEPSMAQKVAKAKSIKGAEERAEQKAEMAEYEKAEQERKQREYAEEHPAKIEVSGKMDEAPAPKEDTSRDAQWPEYKKWLKDTGKTDSPKAWNKFVMENELDPGLKVETKDQAAYNAFRERMEAQKGGVTPEKDTRQPYDAYDAEGRKIEERETARATEMAINEKWFKAEMKRRFPSLTEEELNDRFSRARGHYEKQVAEWEARKDRARRDGKPMTEEKPVFTQMEFDFGKPQADGMKKPSGANEAEGRKAYAEYEAEQRVRADEAELADFAKEEGAAVSEKRARQADLEAAFATWHEAEANAKKVEAAHSKGKGSDIGKARNGLEAAKNRAQEKLRRLSDDDLSDQIGAMEEAAERNGGKLDARTQKQLDAMKQEWTRRTENTPAEDATTKDMSKSAEIRTATESEGVGVHNEASKEQNAPRAVSVRPEEGSSKMLDRKAGGSTPKTNDAAFRAWATGRDGKPLEFATPAEEARSRRRFGALVKMGIIDGETGKPTQKVLDKGEVPKQTKAPPAPIAEETPVKGGETPKQTQEEPKRTTKATVEASTDVTSAQKLLKTKFYQDAKALKTEMDKLPPQATELRTAYKTAIAEAKKRADVRAQIAQETMAEKLADPSFKKWAEKQGVLPTDEHRAQYDAEQIKAATTNLQHWIKGVKVVQHANHQEVPTGSRLLYSKDGQVVGWYDRARHEIHTVPGADVSTFAHEMGWHATYAHAEELAGRGDSKLLDALNKYAHEARNLVVDAATGETLEQRITRQYAERGVTDPVALLDEIGAARFTLEHVAQIKDAAARRQAMNWYQKTGTAIKDAVKGFLTKMGFNRVQLKGLDSMRADEAVSFLADQMVAGKRLGKAGRTGEIDMNREETLVQKHDRLFKDHTRQAEELDKDAGNSREDGIHTHLRTIPGKTQAAVNEALNFYDRIKSACEKAGIKLSEINEYTYAKAAGERNARLREDLGVEDASAMSDADARRIVNTYETSAKGEAIKQIHREIMAFQKRGFDLRRSGGLVGDALWAELSAREPNHAPMKSRFDADGNFTGYDTSSSFGRPEWHKAEGRTNKGAGPLEWIVQEYVDAHARVADNAARRKLFQTILAHPEVGTYERVAPGESGAEMRKKGGTGDPNVVTVKIGGDTYNMRLNGTRGEAIAAAFTGRNLKHAPKSVQKIMRAWSATATELSPTFAGRNWVADMLDVAQVNLGEHGLIKGSWRNAKHVMNTITMAHDVWKYVSKGDATGLNPIIKEAIDGGLLTGGGIRADAFAPDIGKDFGRDFRSGGKVRATAKLLFGWVNKLNQMAEMSNRLADYKLQRDSGMGKNEAVMHAREITVDFNERGELTGWTNAYKMFSNSILGANMRLLRAIAIDPKTGKINWKNGSQVVGAAIGLGAAEALLETHMNGDDEEGRNVTEFTRANSILVRDGKNVYRIPVHKSPLSILKYAGNCAVRVMQGRMKAGDAGYELGSETAGFFLSFFGMGDMNASAMQTLAPSIAQPLVQALQNRDFAGRQISKTNYSDTKPDSSNGRKQTQEGYKWIAQTINELTGGNEARRGAIDYSPEMYKHWVEAIGKNVGRDIQNVLSVAGMVAGTEKVDRRNMPVVRDYARLAPDNDNRYFEAKRAYDKDADEYHKLQLKWPAEKRAAYREERPWVANKIMERMMKGYTTDGRHINGIDDLRHLEAGEYRTKSGEWRMRPTPPTEEQIAVWKEQRLAKQRKFIELMERGK